MNRQEAIANLEMIRTGFVEPVTNEQRKLIDDTFDMAIKALEQEPMIDKIRAEIKHTADEEQKHDEKWAMGLRYAVKIIDKRKAERQEPCEDAISRQAVDTLVDELARAISDERCCISRGRSTATIMQDILDLPSVKPQKNIVNNGTMNITF